MAAFNPGDRPPRLHIDRDRITIAESVSVRTEKITIVNDGGGMLKGTAISDARWINIPNPRIETPFALPFRIEIHPDKVFQGSAGTGKVTIITNGGTAQIAVHYISHPEPRPALFLDERQFQFCNLKKGEDVRFDLLVQNRGSGVLTGTIESVSEWIEIPSRTIWTRTVQAIPVIIHTLRAPDVRQPVGRIRVRTSGGDEEIPVTLHFRRSDGPKIRITPTGVRCVWNKRGLIEENLTIINEGAEVLRGTIPSPVPWMKIIPSIFSAHKETKILLRIDTRMLPDNGTQSISVPIISNVGKHSFTVEAIPGIRHTPQVRKTRVSSRQVPRTRLTAYDPDGKAYILVSSGISGGEGEIYFLTGDDSRCAKIFHPHRRTPEIEEKLRCMIQTPPPLSICTSLTWPEILLTDLPRGGRALGYLMRRIVNDFRAAHLWYDESEEAEGSPRQTRILAAYNFSKIVVGIHAAGHVIGDLRENNLLVSEKGEVILIDTDSLQVCDPKTGRVFWSRVGTGEYLPPEHLDGSFAEEGCDRREGDLFALAILIFRFLMDGVHPFQAKGPLVRDAPATTDKIRLGYFAFERRQAGVSPPEYAPPYEQVPHPVRALFKEAFITGHSCPAARPGPDAWVRTLSSLIPGGGRHVTDLPHTVMSTEPANTEPDVWYATTRGGRIQIGEVVRRISKGFIRSCNIPGTQIVLTEGAQECLCPDGEQSRPHPVSLVCPEGQVLRNGTVPVGWLIPEIGTEYHHWHVIADSQSRSRCSQGFGFNRRVACCRNLMAAVISAQRLEIPCFLSERTIFVGPDASVRILYTPRMKRDRNQEEGGGISPAVLIFRMLMNGFHPFHAVGPKVHGYGSHERRMKAGLYPWLSDDEDLRPPMQAPSIDIIPCPIRELFETELDSSPKKREQVPGEIWFQVLDTVFRQLIRCTRDAEHWYLPGKGGCPWCAGRERSFSTPQRIIQLQLPPPPRQLLLAGSRISGLLTVPPVRCIILPYSGSCGSTIPLPAYRSSEKFLPPAIVRAVLPAGGKAEYLPMVVRRGWLICLPKQKIQSSISGVKTREQTADHVSCLAVNFSAETIAFCEDISLIDEMRWVSAMDRLRGEGVGQPKKRRGVFRRGLAIRKRPIQIMLLPLDIHLPQVPDEVLNAVPDDRRKKPKHGNKKSIRGRIQTLIQDIFKADLYKEEDD